MKEKWVVITKGADFKQIGREFSIDPVVARVIRNRDIVGSEAIRMYLRGNLEDLHSPWDMKDMEKATAILGEKIGQGKHIRVIGDYDIDGIMSTYILVEALNRMGGVVDAAIPDRITDGYGLNERLIHKAAEDGTDTVLTCDNGIAAEKEIRLGQELGMTVIVTDHHEVPYEEQGGQRIYRLPSADAIVNPRQPDCSYPFPKLCGAAVALKLVQALFQRQGREEREYLEFLPYAAFATVGDVMELVEENRILVKEGLRMMQSIQNPGLLALMHQNQLNPQNITPYHVGFVLGPCLNASGRLDTALRALRLLQTRTESEAVSLARDLTDLNQSRKELTRQGVEEACLLAQEALARGDKVLALYLPECHESLAGIIAGQIRERYNHPTFILTRGAEGVKGSGRSIECYSMFEELSKVKDLFLKFGGHPMAAGLSLREEDVPEMSRRLNGACALTDEDFVPKIRIDVPMPLDYITMELVEQLELLAPYGHGNEKPLFADKNIGIRSVRVVGKNHNVCKLQLISSQGNCFDGVYFGNSENFKNFLIEKYGEKAVSSLYEGISRNPNSKPKVQISAVYYPEQNVFHGTVSLQIVIKKYA